MHNISLFIADNLWLSIPLLLISIFFISVLIFRLIRKITHGYIWIIDTISKNFGYFFSETVPGTLILSTFMLFISISGEEINKVGLCLAIFGYVKAIIYAIQDATKNKEMEV